MNPTLTQNIQHVVVLMLENRSCDHLFGDYLHQNSGKGSISGYNLSDPSNPYNTVPTIPHQCR